MTNSNETLEHGHPHYVRIWVWLVAALGLSMFIGEMTVPVVAVVLIFTIAIVKAYLVVAYYMHVRFEPLFVTLILGAALVCLYVLFFGLVPDVVYGPIL